MSGITKAISAVAAVVIVSLSVAPTLAAPQVSEFERQMDAAMMRMHHAMSIQPSGDPDRDFAAMMIPHHEGAIEMARIQLQFGKDERLRRLAQAIIVEQSQEIDVMRQILAASNSKQSVSTSQQEKLQ